MSKRSETTVVFSKEIVTPPSRDLYYFTQSNLIICEPSD